MQCPYYTEGNGPFYIRGSNVCYMNSNSYGDQVT